MEYSFIHMFIHGMCVFSLSLYPVPDPPINLTAIPFGTQHVRLNWLKPMTGDECTINNALRGCEEDLEYFVQIIEGASLNIKQESYENIQVFDITNLSSTVINHTFEVHVRQKLLLHFHKDSCMVQRGSYVYVERYFSGT